MFKLKSVEKEVMCHLSRNVELSTKELSEKIGINYWTLYKVMNRLYRLGAIREVVIPNFKFMDYEIFVAGYGNLTKKRIQELWKLRNSGEFSEYSPSIFYGIAESYRGFVFALVKNYTSIKRTMMSAEKVIKIREIIRSREINNVLLPIEMLKIPVFFDYSGILCKEAGISRVAPLPVPAKKPDRRLIKREKIAMMHLVDNPRISLSELASKLNSTIQTASKIRKRLFDEGWLIRRIIPDLRIFGYNVMVFAHWHSNPNNTLMMGEINRGITKFDVDISNITFLGYDPLEGIALGAFRNLKESREIISFFEKLGEGTGVLDGEPTIIFLSLEEGIKIRDHEYSGIVSDFSSFQ